MTRKELKELREAGYESEEELLSELLGIDLEADPEYTIEDFLDSWDPDW